MLEAPKKRLWKVYESGIRAKIEDEMNELEEEGYEVRKILHMKHDSGDAGETVWLFARLRGGLPD